MAAASGERQNDPIEAADPSVRAVADVLQPGLFDSAPNLLAPAEPREEPPSGIARVRLPSLVHGQ